MLYVRIFTCLLTSNFSTKADLFAIKKPFIHNQGLTKIPNLPEYGSDMSSRDRINILENRASDVYPYLYYLLWWEYSNIPQEPDSSDKARANLKKAAELGYPRAHSQLGVSSIFDLNEGPDYYSAKRDFELALQLGDLNASFALAEMSMEGVVGKPDYQQTLAYYQIAAGLDNAEAHFKLGYLYAFGYGGNVQFDLALQHWGRASELDSVDADYQLGNYYFGLKEEKWVRKGLHHLTKAAKFGHIPSIDLLGWYLLNYFYIDDVVCETIISVLSQIPDKQNLTVASYIKLFEWRKRLFSTYGDMFHMGEDKQALYAISPLLQYEVGFHLYLADHDKDLGMRFLDLAAESGNPEAQYLLARINLNESDASNTSDKAIKYLISAAKSRHFLAIRTLGDLFYEGKRVDRDYQLSLKYYKRGAEFGDSYCMNKVGYFYTFGLGAVSPDKKQAVKCFKKTGEFSNTNGIYRLALLRPDDADTKSLFLKAAELGMNQAKRDYIQFIWTHGGSRDEIIKACVYGQSLNDKTNHITTHDLLFETLSHEEKNVVKKMSYMNFCKDFRIPECGGLELAAFIGPSWHSPAIFRLSILEDMSISGAYFHMEDKKQIQLRGYISGNFLIMDETHDGKKTGHIRINLKDPFLSFWHAPNNSETMFLEIIHYGACKYEQFFAPTSLHSFGLTHELEVFGESGPHVYETTDRVNLFRFADEYSSSSAILSMDIMRSNARSGSFNGLVEGSPWTYGYHNLKYEMPECMVEVSIPNDNSFLIVKDDCPMCCGLYVKLEGFYPKTKLHSFDLTDLP